METTARSFRRVALVGRHHTPGIGGPLSRLADFLVARGLVVVLEADTAEQVRFTGYESVPASQLGAAVDLVIAIGGDGTMLSIARQLAPFGIPLIGINQGRLGFLTDIALSEMEPVLEDMLAGRFVEEQRTLLAASLSRDVGWDGSAPALNEIVVNRGALGGMIDCAVSIDGHFVYAMRADGLIVATPTGSTAYALSAQGPIVDPAVAAILLVPVAPHALTNRPIAVRDHAVIEITLLRGKDASVHCDGQTHCPLVEGDRITVRRAEHRVRLLHPQHHDYFAMLRQKLHWSETPERLGPA